ncbi:chaperonin GroEL [bacterium]|nr:chaperonin GroEL [bacterium]|tara:strand:- start:19602 stop:21284 length:1683 start_codon:yes stop_codon:yes gene_type:complete
MSKQITFDSGARKALRGGIDKLARAVKMTLGPRGRSVVIEKGYGAPQVTVDGVTVAKEIELEDKYENLGADLIKQAADKTNDNVGDGTSTSVIITHSIIEEGEKAVKEKNFNVIQLADELTNGTEKIIKALEEQGEPINDPKKVEEVAALSAKDAEIGKLISKIIAKVGKDGVITIEDSNTVTSDVEVVEGLQFDRGYISPYMVTDTGKMEAVFDNPHILITDQKISSIKDILPLLESLAGTGKKELVIIADDVDGEALATLVVNKLRGALNVLAVKAPGFGDRKKESLEDIAIMTGGTVVSEEVGIKLESATVQMLGKARRVITTKDNTTIVGGKGKKKDVEERVSQLRSQHEKSESSYEKDQLQERIGKLSGGVGVIKVGAPTESAQKELKQRVEDAVAATKAAMEQGIVPGGGIALAQISLSQRKNEGESGHVKEHAQAILMKALVAPLTAIVENSGMSPDKVMKEIEEKRDSIKSEAGKRWIGFNASENEVQDLKKAGIIDPLKVTKTAFQNAVSVAANYLTIGAAITNVPKKEEPQDPGMGGIQGMGGGMPGMDY